MTRMDTNKELVYAKEVYAIVGAAMEVHNTFGAGAAEAIYQESMEIELGLRGIPFERQKQLKVVYKGVTLQCEFVADLVCFGAIIVEIKAIEKLLPIHDAQVLSYLRLTRKKVGLLMNFHVPVLKDGLKRIVNEFPDSASRR